MFGVYVHVPFCSRRCDYCAFATWTDRFHLVDDYVEACARDARARLDPGRGADSVDAGRRERERLMLALRTREGVVPPAGRHGEIADLVEAGLLQHDGPRVVLTRRGRLLASEVTLRLLPDSVSTR